MKRFIDISMRILFLFAAVWSIGAGLWILITPQAIHVIEAATTADGASQTEETIKQVSFYQVQGAWGVFILIVFAGLYCLPAFFFLRDRILPGAILGLLALVLTYLAGFSIGPFYLPAAAALLIGIPLWFGVRSLAKPSTG